MKIKSIMHTKLIYVLSDKTLRDCITIMKNKNIGFLIIKNNADELLGIITDRDLLLGLLKYKLSDSIIYLVKTDVIYINENSSLYEACDTCGCYQKTRLLVKNEFNVICGVVSIFDLLQIPSIRSYAADSILEIKKDDILSSYDIECDVNLINTSL